MKDAPENRSGETFTVPLHEEQVRVSHRVVEGEGVRVDKLVRERNAQIDELLTREDIAVERVPIGRHVTEVPPVREDGETLVIPLVEEVVVVERRLVLREEVHLRRVRSTVRHRDTVPVRSEEAQITHLPAEEERAHSGDRQPRDVRSESSLPNEEPSS